MVEELSKRDHRVIGRELDLFSFHEYAPGQPIWHNNGYAMLEELENYMGEKLSKGGYQKVKAPILWRKDLFETSGHWEHYKKDMFVINVDEQEFGLKPMNCPGHAIIFKSQTRSYRDMPIRLAEKSPLHRNELSGVLTGLLRVLSFTQDDAHIYCRQDQVQNEVTNVLGLMKDVYGTFGFEYNMKLSTRPEKRIGTDDLWDTAEDALRVSLKDNNIDYTINEADGAFYGPKIDVDIQDSLGRKWQCATIQLDYNQGNRFDLNYVGEDGNKHRPVVIHRAIYGSYERFMGILIEHFDGKFPTWLSPIQASILPVSDKAKDYADQIYSKLQDNGVRVKMNSDNTLGYRIREDQKLKIPNIVVVGDKEKETGTVSVRKRNNKTSTYQQQDFITELKNEITSRTLPRVE